MLVKSRAVLVGALALAAAFTWSFAAQKSPQLLRREGLTKDANAGNYKDAYDGLRKLALDPKDDPEKVGEDLVLAINCLRSLGRHDEVDEFREAVVRVHRGNWRLLETAAQTWAEVEHYGYLVAGKFYRGIHRGGGRYVNTTGRDRVRALQLMQQALPLTKADADRSAVAGFHLRFAELVVRGAGRHEAWRLQYLTDLSKLPDYEDGYGYGGDGRGAPVDADGKPVYYHVPNGYETAASDGERWRWLLARAVEIDPARLSEAEVAFANFLHGQFGAQTLASGGRHFPAEDEDKKDKSGTYALHTLTDDETVARLATGVKRFKLP
ncbi:MAG TPA: hypothetical protein VFE78_38385, partial [Gemmataceae bacterium]|nr:hypothetical protein [Gemmataceae bacterium]